LDAQIAEEIEDALKNDPNGPKMDVRQMFLDAEIIDVLTYRDDFAVVTYKENRDGAGPYGGVLFGKINGVWKSLTFGLPLDDSPGDLSSPSVKAVAERVDRKKDDYWRQFVEVRNEVLNGRTPMIDAKGGAASAESTKSEKTTVEKTATPLAQNSKSQQPSLSAAEKEDVKGWQIGIDLDMPSLEPQAVQFAIFDKDPVAAFVAQVKRRQNFSRQQLEKVKNEAVLQADKLVQEAEEKGRILREEAARAAEKIRQEADVQSQKLIKEAEPKGTMARLAAQKAADTVKKEADKKADQIVREADARSLKLVEEAKAKREELINKL
jgi:hypothetical protein